MRRVEAWFGRPMLWHGLAIGGGWLGSASGLSGSGTAACVTVPLIVAAGLVIRDGGRARAAARRSDEAWGELSGMLGEGGVRAAADEGVPDGVRGQVRRLMVREATEHAILEAIDEPVVALDRDGMVLMVNRRAARLLSPGTAVSMVGRPLDQLLPDENILTLARAAVGGRAGQRRVRVLTGDGPRIIEATAEPIEGGPAGSAGSAAALLAMRDVTEQATALQLKTDFVANASHELRTPLASIKTASETLVELSEGMGAMESRLVEMIASNAERLEELVRDLLDLSSLESRETESAVEPVDAFEVCKELIALFEPMCAARGVGIRLELDPRLGRMWTDPKLVRLVLRNLVDNAVKFAYQDTAVVVRGTVSAPPGREGLHDARLQVIDQGIGIPIAQQKRIFERFYQVDEARSGSRERRGTGLGLAIVKHALRAMGGDIRVESVWKEGTTMTVELPESVEPAETAPVTGSRVSP